MGEILKYIISILLIFTFMSSAQFAGANSCFPKRDLTKNPLRFKDLQDNKSCWQSYLRDEIYCSQRGLFVQPQLYSRFTRVKSVSHVEPEICKKRVDRSFSVCWKEGQRHYLKAKRRGIRSTKSLKVFSKALGQCSYKRVFSNYVSQTQGFGN